MPVLRDYLLSKGAITGPTKKNTSYSHLCTLKSLLLGFGLFVGDEYFLWFGAALHELFLENKRGAAYKKLKPWDQVKIEKMVERLRKHAVVKKLFEKSIREDKKYLHCKELFDLEFAFVLDMDQPHANTGSDLKSTKSKNIEDCKKSYIVFGYAGQGVLYKLLTKRKNFFFLFISKQAPYDIFILNTADFKAEEKYAFNELKFLSYFYKHYGMIINQHYAAVKELEMLTNKIESICQTKQGSSALKKSEPSSKNSKPRTVNLTQRKVTTTKRSTSSKKR